MSRPNSGGFLFGFVVEIAIVVAVVSLLPRVDLSGKQTAADLPPRLLPQETSYYQRQPEPVSRPVAVAPAPRITPQPLETFITRPPQAAEQREPPPLIVVDPGAQPAFVEQRLDRASQGLVNGLGDYFVRTAESIAPTPALPAETTRSAPGGSFPTRPVRATLPRPWMRY